MRHPLLSARFALACLLPLALTVAGCSSPEPSASETVATWQIAPDPPRVGPATVTVALADAAGRPVRGAEVTLEGTMTHPGMKPSLGQAREVAPGRYEATLELTMGGDWVLLMDATLPDGRSVHQQKELPGVRTL